MYQIGLFATGRGQGSRGLLQAIHESIESGHLPVHVAFVFSNREPGEFEATDGFFRMVRDFGYPLVTLSFRKFRSQARGLPDWRLRYDREVMRRLETFSPDLCVMAGYLLIVSPELCRRYPLVNLHPAAPGGPVGMWQEVIWQLIEKRAEASGNTMFYVTEDLDRGPTATYSTFPIRGEAFDGHWRAIQGRPVAEIRAREGEDLPLFQVIREHGMIRERPLVVETVKAIAEGRMRIRGGEIVDVQGKRIQGLDLTREIEALVAKGQTV